MTGPDTGFGDRVLAEDLGRAWAASPTSPESTFLAPGQTVVTPCSGAVMSAKESE